MHGDRGSSSAEHCGRALARWSLMEQQRKGALHRRSYVRAAHGCDGRGQRTVPSAGENSAHTADSLPEVALVRAESAKTGAAMARLDGRRRVDGAPIVGLWGGRSTGNSRLCWRCTRMTSASQRPWTTRRAWHGEDAAA
ncbi:uncharacterized protein M6B38_321140 [Iris pallida]|uniref:Uncharacterized protein n=1 Tax=Iris pallida TaxID=29817 RepID=A0AAX6HC93_IRIPA|nr:uncharacterized protein M6B38_321140 [Iris pallida]